MVKGVVKCSSNCSNPELSGTVDIFSLGTGTWNISAQNLITYPEGLVQDGYYINTTISVEEPADIVVHNDPNFLTNVRYQWSSPTIYQYKKVVTDGSITYEFKDSMGRIRKRMMASVPFISIASTGVQRTGA